MEEWENINQDNLKTTEETDNFPDMVRQLSKETCDGDTTQRIQEEHSTLIKETSLLPTKNSRLLTSKELTIVTYRRGGTHKTELKEKNSGRTQPTERTKYF